MGPSASRRLLVPCPGGLALLLGSWAEDNADFNEPVRDERREQETGSCTWQTRIIINWEVTD